MSKLQEIINRHTHALPLMERIYSSQLPNPQKIVEEAGLNGVAELFNEIATISTERDRLDREGEVNCDELDDYWRAAFRLASLIPYQARLYPKEILKGLSNESEEVRFYVAYSLEKAPFRGALPFLKNALRIEPIELNIRVIASAIQACSSYKLCGREFMQKVMNNPIPWGSA